MVMAVNTPTQDPIWLDGNQPLDMEFLSKFPLFFFIKSAKKHKSTGISSSLGLHQDQDMVL